MSYGFSLCFREVRSEEDALLLGDSFAHCLRSKQNITELLSQSAFYIPSNRYHQDTNPGLMSQLDQYWLESLMTPNFIYWPEFKIVAVVGETWPELETFFPHSVYFQNSCDQDYSYDTWNGIEVFEKVVAKVQGMTDAEVLTENVEVVDNDEYIDYQRRTMVYRKIFDMLHLDAWLNDQDDLAFHRFSISALHGFYDSFNFYSKYLKPFLKSINI